MRRLYVLIAGLPADCAFRRKTSPLAVWDVHLEAMVSMLEMLDLLNRQNVRIWTGKTARPIPFRRTFMERIDPASLKKTEPRKTTRDDVVAVFSAWGGIKKKDAKAR